MKKLILLSTISLCLFSIVNSQTKIRLSDKFYFSSSFSDITINKETDTTIINKDGMQLENRQIQLNAPIYSLQSIAHIENNKMIFFDIESKPESYESKAVDSRLADTLFFVLDQVYYDWVDRIMINREISSGLEQPIWVNDTLAYKVLEPCTLNIFSNLRQPYNYSELSFIFIENYEFTGKDTIFLSSSDAIHNLIWDPVDINGNPLSEQGLLKNKLDIFFPIANGGNAHCSYSIINSGTYKISDYHGVIPMLFGSELDNTSTDSSNFLIEYPQQDSIMNDITFTNDPQDYIKLNTKLYFPFDVKHDTNKVGLVSITKFINWDGYEGWSGSTGYFYHNYASSWNTALYFDLQDFEEFGYGMFFTSNYIKNSEEIEFMNSPLMDEYDGFIVGTDYIIPEPDLHLFPYNDLAQFGKGYSYYWSGWENYPTVIACETDNIGMYGEFFNQNIETDTYKIKDDNDNIISEGVGLNVHSPTLEPGHYYVVQKRLATDFDAYSGTSTLKYGIYTALEDNTPPHLIRIYLQNNNNNLKYNYQAGESIILTFTASDFIFYNNFHGGIGYQPFDVTKTNVSIKLHDESEWTDVDFSELINDTIIGIQYLADLTDYLTNDSALYDVKIYIVDLSRNSSECILSPAFNYGDFVVGITDDNNSGENNDISIYPNPAHKEIVLSYKPGEADTYKIINMNGKVLKKGEINRNSNSLKVNISDLSPGIYLITVNNEGTPVFVEKFLKY